MSLRSPRARLLLTRLAGWLACFLVLAGGRSAYGQDLRLQFHAGLVDLSAHAVTVAEILARWSEVGGTTVVNGDQVQSGPVTIDLVDAPEQVALAVILRSVPGYLLAERADRTGARSVIDRIAVLATRTAPPTFPIPVAVVRSSPPAVSVSQPTVVQSVLPEPDEPNRDGLVIISSANDAAKSATDVSSPQGTTPGLARPGTVQSSARPGMIGATTPTQTSGRAGTQTSGRAGETAVPYAAPAYIPNSPEPPPPNQP